MGGQAITNNNNNIGKCMTGHNYVGHKTKGKCMGGQAGGRAGRHTHRHTYTQARSEQAHTLRSPRPRTRTHARTHAARPAWWAGAGVQPRQAGSNPREYGTVLESRIGSGLDKPLHLIVMPPRFKYRKPYDP